MLAKLVAFSRKRLSRERTRFIPKSCMIPCPRFCIFWHYEHKHMIAKSGFTDIVRDEELCGLHHVFASYPYSINEFPRNISKQQMSVSNHVKILLQLNVWCCCTLRCILCSSLVRVSQECSHITSWFYSNISCWLEIPPLLRFLIWTSSKSTASLNQGTYELVHSASIFPLSSISMVVGALKIYMFIKPLPSTEKKYNSMKHSNLP